MVVSYHQSNKKRRIRKALMSRPSVQTSPFYDLLEKLQRGVYPHNDEIKMWMRSMRSSRAFSSAGLSEIGRKLMRDVEELFTVLERKIDSKNKDELFQRVATESVMQTGGKLQFIPESKQRSSPSYLGVIAFLIKDLIQFLLFCFDLEYKVDQTRKVVKTLIHHLTGNQLLQFTFINVLVLKKHVRVCNRERSLPFT